MRKIKKLASIAVLSAMLSLSIAGAVNATQIGDHGDYEGGVNSAGYVYSKYYDNAYRWYRASVETDRYKQDTINIHDKRYGEHAYASLKERWGKTDYSWYNYGGGRID